MNKIEANISIFGIVFFAAVQYVFLAGVPSDLSPFAFQCITNFIGLLMALAFFFNELFRLEMSQVKQSAVLSLQLIGYNLFLMMGSQSFPPAVVSSIVSGYFIFILIFETVIKRKLPDKFSVISVFTVLTGLFLMMNADITPLFNAKIIYILLADIFVAIYIMTIGRYASSSNPAILAMGQMFFSCIFTLILWIGEAIFTGVTFSLPTDKDFWVGVIYISFFIRFFYSIIQIYAQRYVSPLNISIIISSGLVITLLVSPLISPLSVLSLNP
ncbi:MAG: EamA family transporter [Synergistaceae bacterium]|nr:EamA family transporter [Synergistaceae bacterium]